MSIHEEKKREIDAKVDAQSKSSYLDDLLLYAKLMTEAHAELSKQYEALKKEYGIQMEMGRRGVDTWKKNYEELQKENELLRGASILEIKKVGELRRQLEEKDRKILEITDDMKRQEKHISEKNCSYMEFNADYYIKKLRALVEKKSEPLLSCDAHACMYCKKPIKEGNCCEACFMSRILKGKKNEKGE